MDKDKKTGDVNEGIRLHVFLARHGVGSRRQCEEYISEGLVRVNGRIQSELGSKVTPSDLVEYKGRKVSWKDEKKVYIALYKPEKYICSHKDVEDRPLAVNLVQPFFTERLFYVGRLDYMTSGLIFLTNDGEFAKKLMHPSFEVEKEYEVKTAKEIPGELLERFKRGMWVNGERYQLKNYYTRGSREANIVLTEGKNQEIRQVFLSAYVAIKRIHRIRIGHVTLRGLAPGQFRKLNKQELEGLLLDAQPKKLRIYKTIEPPIQARKAYDFESSKRDWVETEVRQDPAILREKREKMEEEKRLRDEERKEQREAERLARLAEQELEGVENEHGFVESPETNNQLLFDFGDEFKAPEPEVREFREDRPRRDRGDFRREGGRPYDSDRPRRDFGGDRPRRDFSGDRGGFNRPRSFGEDRPRRSFGEDRPRREGEREERGSFDRPRRDFGGDRPRRDFGGRPGGMSGGAGRSHGSRPGGFGSKGGFGGNRDRRPSGRR